MKIKPFYIVIIILIAAIAVIWLSAHKKAPAPVNSQGENLAGLQTGDAPWIAETDHLKDRLSAIGLPALNQEGTALHTHQHLDIFVDGKPVAVPAFIGINEAAGFISEIHVHDDTQVIHVESPVVQTFTLGQFFDIWGVRLTADCIGGYCTTTNKTLKSFVNGTLVTGNPRDIQLTAHEEIVLTYGTDAELPNPIPKTYSFAPGL
jgi:hypothetical protein